MKKLRSLILFVMLSISAYSQGEYRYTNAGYGVEVKFPAKPEIIPDKTSAGTQNATLQLPSVGLSYIVLITKGSDLVKTDDMIKVWKKVGQQTIKSKYEVGGEQITEFDLLSGGGCMRYKVMDIRNGLLTLMVVSQSCASDKDVMPFFNSLKVDGVAIQDPNTDTSKFKTFEIDYPAITKTDTVKQIVYVESGSKKGYSYEKKSEVDKNIPSCSETNPYRFALIVGNEDYSSHQTELASEINVDFARNDASAFREYALTTLGIPEKNIIFQLDATTGQMNQGITKMNLILKNSQGMAEVFVYYAGHGLPDEQTKEAWLMPVDVSGKNVGDGIKLQDLYSRLTEYPAKRITVFIDACFSGGARNQALLAARGVKVKPREDLLKGNLVVFTASSGEQSALSYKEKEHGLFTYYLLRKLQESKGSVSYNELSKYIIQNVSLQSVLINDKEQSPQVIVSNSINGEWGSYDLSK